MSWGVFWRRTVPNSLFVVITFLFLGAGLLAYGFGAGTFKNINHDINAVMNTVGTSSLIFLLLLMMQPPGSSEVRIFDSL